MFLSLGSREYSILQWVYLYLYLYHVSLFCLLSLVAYYFDLINMLQNMKNLNQYLWKYKNIGKISNNWPNGLYRIHVYKNLNPCLQSMLAMLQ